MIEYFNGKNRRPAVARIYTKFIFIRLKSQRILLNLHGVPLCLVGGIFSVAKSKTDKMKKLKKKIVFIPNNDFKYSVAFVGVLAIDESPRKSMEIDNTSIF